MAFDFATSQRLERKIGRDDAATKFERKRDGDCARPCADID